MRQQALEMPPQFTLHRRSKQSHSHKNKNRQVQKSLSTAWDLFQRRGAATQIPFPFPWCLLEVNIAELYEQGPVPHLLEGPDTFQQFFSVLDYMVGHFLPLQLLLLLYLHLLPETLFWKGKNFKTHLLNIRTILTLKINNLMDNENCSPPLN